MIELFFALIGSKWVRGLGLCLAVLGGYAWWEARTEQKGAEKVLIKVERKVSQDNEAANEIRTDVAAGKRGKPDPNRLRNVR